MPTLAGFLAWIRATMGVPASALPDAAPVIAMAYNLSIATVLSNPIASIAPIIYADAVYNLAGDTLVQIASDQPGSTYFAALRTSLGLTGTGVLGVVQSSSDNGTSSSLVVPDFYKNLSLADYSYFHTPWGRQYLAYAQQFGTIWGIT